MKNKLIYFLGFLVILTGYGAYIEQNSWTFFVGLCTGFLFRAVTEYLMEQERIKNESEFIQSHTKEKL